MFAIRFYRHFNPATRAPERGRRATCGCDRQPCRPIQSKSARIPAKMSGADAGENPSRMLRDRPAFYTHRACLENYGDYN